MPFHQLPCTNSAGVLCYKQSDCGGEAYTEPAVLLGLIMATRNVKGVKVAGTQFAHELFMKQLLLLG